ncbi:MAG: 1-acyl-sn-glycerol-3-phosphate acyltransferase, partial [Actinobacteria bacterium]|nr:1-acyl-sn-glycerol-3-phosphate acyltransferase [Actinomycetota bacterium]
MKGILGPYLKLAYRVRIEGVENFPKEGPVIVVGNHTSFLDSFWIPLAVPRRVVFLAKAEYFESWKTAWFFRSLGMIPVKRGSRHMAEAALQTGVEVLEEGGVLGLYPEGTRSPDGRLYRGRTGVARLAVKAKAPVVAIGMIGSPYGEVAERALRDHPDRFVASLEIDPNDITKVVRRIRKAYDERGIKAVTSFPAGCNPQVPVNDRRYYPIYQT